MQIWSFLMNASLEFLSKEKVSAHGLCVLLGSRRRRPAFIEVCWVLSNTRWVYSSAFSNRLTTRSTKNQMCPEAYPCVGGLSKIKRLSECFQPCEIRRVLTSWATGVSLTLWWGRCSVTGFGGTRFSRSYFIAWFHLLFKLYNIEAQHSLLITKEAK